MGVISRGFTVAHYWNNDWYVGGEINNYNGSLWRLTAVSINEEGLDQVSLVGRLAQASGTGTLTIRVTTATTNTGGVAASFPFTATNADQLFQFDYTKAMRDYLNGKSTFYVFLTATSNIMFYGIGASDSAVHHHVAYVDPTARVYRDNNFNRRSVPFVWRSNTWNPSRAFVYRNNNWNNVGG